MATGADPSGLSGDAKGPTAVPKTRNPHVFLDISVDQKRPEKITFELFANIVPKTAENFRCLCTGERVFGASERRKLHYKGTVIHRIVKGFIAQGGDIWEGDGCGGESGKFADENFTIKHDCAGVLSMANSGKHTNGSQFFITFNADPYLDGKYVAFGRAFTGIALLKKLEEVGSRSGLW